MEKDIFDSIDADDAYVILKILAKKDKDIAKRIEKVALDYLSEVNPDDIATDVYSVLNYIDVEEVWDSSGGTRWGYVDPTEASWKAFEEAMEPFLKELEKYQDLSMLYDAKSYCKGILQGLNKFEEESESEYRDWAEDCPGHYGAKVLDKWKQGIDDPQEVTEMEEFFRERFSDRHLEGID